MTKLRSLCSIFLALLAFHAGSVSTAGEEVGPPAPKKATAEKKPLDLAALAARFKAIQETYNKLGAEFQSASAARKAAIRAEAQKLQQEAETVIDQAAGVVPEEFKKNPKNEHVTLLLPLVLQRSLVKHRFGEAISLGEEVMKKNAGVKGVGEVLGLALFAENRFQEASQVLEKEAAAKRLSRRGEYFRKEARRYIKLWQKEEELRAKEKKADDLPRVKLETSRGTIVLELFENEAPKTVGNFVSLVEKGFYNATAFHRVIPLFMAQGGDPNSKDADPSNDGKGGPGYTIPCECYRPDHRNHFAGSLSMAHAGRDTGGSQFFLTHVPTPHLNGRHTVFGRVIEGLQVVRALQKGDKVLTATVLRKRQHPYAPPPDAKKAAGPKRP